MASSGYTAITFVANEQPTTAKWNLIGSNDASFNSGNGFEDGIIIARHLAANILANATTAINKTIDANGWTVYNLGALKLYLKRGTLSSALAGNTWSALSVDNLPVGFSTIGSTNILVGAVSTDDKAIRVQLEPQAGNSAIILSRYNAYTSTVTTGYYWSVCIISL